MIHSRDGVREAPEQFPAMPSGMRLRRSRNEKRAGPPEFLETHDAWL
jgi:hypothetical protein